MKGYAAESSRTHRYPRSYHSGYYVLAAVTCYDAGMNIFSAELHRRSVVKAVSYRAINIIIDAAVVYFFTRSAPFSLGIVLLLNTYSTVLYYFHERIWAHIHWGRRPVSG